MTITEATKKISQALASGKINNDVAVKAQASIRDNLYYGMRMSPIDRARIVNVRFGL